MIYSRTGRGRAASAVFGAALALCLLMTLKTAAGSKSLGKAPDFPSRDQASWIGEPQTWKGLEGKVVILDVWTFG